MTLIGQFLFRGLPITVGDLLATAEADTADVPNIFLAGRADVNQHLKHIGAPFVVHKLVQKINKLSDRFYVAVAGDSNHIVRLLRRLSCIANDQDLSFSKVSKIIDTIDPAEREHVHAIGMITKNNNITGGTDFECFDYKVTRRASAFYGDISAAGTGSESLVTLLEAMAPTAADLGDDPTAAMELGYLIQSFLAGVDIANGGNVLSRWGGGFEVVTFDIEEMIFKKQDKVTHIFMYAAINEDNITTELIPSVIYQCYKDDILYQHVIEWRQSGSSQMEMSRNDILYAPPALFEGTIDIEHITHNIKNDESRHLCCHTMAHGLREPIWDSRIFHNAPGKPLFTYEARESGVFSYALSPDVPEKVIEALRTARAFYS